MKLNRLALGVSAAAVATAISATAVQAQEFTTSGSFGVFSDYRLRGVSLSDGEMVIQGAFQGDLMLNEAVTVYAGAWMSSLDVDAGFGALETDLYVGATGAVGDLTWDAKYLRLVYVDATGVDFDQYAVTLGYPIGPFSGSLGVVQDEYDPGSSTYIWTGLGYDLPDTPLSFSATLGHEDGAYGFDDKVNWGLGVSYAFQNLSLNAEYIDTNKEVISPTSGDLADSTIVFSITSAF